MIVFAINNLSLERPLVSQVHFEDRLNGILKCIDIISFALKQKCVSLCVDTNLEQEIIIGTEKTFAKALSQASDRDAVKRWFIYTRNHADLLQGEQVEVEIMSRAADGAVFGLLHAVAIERVNRWISFFGLPQFASDTIEIRDIRDPQFQSFGNSDCQDRLRKWWPQYEASPKHRKASYKRSGGKRVAPMSLDHAEAQEALDISVVNGKRRIAEYKGRLIIFMNTRENVFHGYELDDG